MKNIFVTMDLHEIGWVFQIKKRDELVHVELYIGNEDQVDRFFSSSILVLVEQAETNILPGFSHLYLLLNILIDLNCKMQLDAEFCSKIEGSVIT